MGWIAFAFGYLCAGLMSLAARKSFGELVFVVTLVASLYVVILYGIWIAVWETFGP